MNNLENFKSKRQQYPEFIYHGFDIDEKDESIDIKYTFEIVGLSKFEPTWSFPKPSNGQFSKMDKNLFENLVFSLGMVELVSYWKLTCSPNVKILCGELNQEQIEWWKKLYFNGLGEFLYTNSIYDYLVNQNIELTSISCCGKLRVCNDKKSALRGNLIPIGGGKDSVVTLELLSRSLIENTCYIVNPRGATEATAAIAGYAEQYTPKRTLDKNMLEFNLQGFLNGHTPFSAILAFSAYIAANILGKKYIILSNEASADEPNVKGTNINHQYSKSFEFENDFRYYAKSYLQQHGPVYFSILRPWSEWQIIKEFVKYPKYFSQFKSCNVGSKQDIWCENCPKCLYVYIMLSAFLNEEQMGEIFKTNMLENEELKDIFEGLVYPDENKPFECVGTKEEINLSLNMHIRQLQSQGKAMPKLLQGYKQLNDNEYDNLKSTYSNNFANKNNVPELFKILLRRG